MAETFRNLLNRQRCNPGEGPNGCVKRLTLNANARRNPESGLIFWFKDIKILNLSVWTFHCNHRRRIVYMYMYIYAIYICYMYMLYIYAIYICE